MKKSFLLASVAAVALSMLSLETAAFAQQAPTASRAQPVSPAAQAESQQEPLGLPLYRDQFQTILEIFELLADNNQVAPFKAEWEHKFDHNSDLMTEEGTNRAIEQLVKVGTRLGCPEQPDYKCMYMRALRAYMQFHYSPDSPVNMADPIQRARWVAEWEHKFDSEPAVFKSDAATLNAIRLMRDSLHLRFDYVQSRERTVTETKTRKANFGGLGIHVGMNNRDNVALGSRLTVLVHEPPSSSPSYGLVHYGDVVLKIGDRAVAEMTIGEVEKALFGEPGSKISLTIRRGGQSADARMMTVSLERAYTPDPSGNIIKTGITDAGVPIEFVGEDGLALGPGFELVANGAEKGTPADGIVEPGDLIVSVDNQTLAGKTVNQAVELLRGAADSPVTLTVERNGQRKEFTLKRAVIQEHSVLLESLGDGINLLHIRSFYAQNLGADLATAIAKTVLPLASKTLRTAGDADSLKKAARFDELKANLDKGQILEDDMVSIAVEAREVYEKGGTGGGFILNLADNPGGDVEQVKQAIGLMLPFGETSEVVRRLPGTDEIEVTESFLTPDLEFVTVHHGGKTSAMPKPRVPLLLPSNLPFVIIINGSSASGSEWLAGVMQSNHRARLHGLGSRGKSEGQSGVDIPYGFSLHVTNFEFFPGGQKSNVTGLVVDKEVLGDLTAMVNSAREEIYALNKQQLLRFDATQKQSRARIEGFERKVRERAAVDGMPLEQQDPVYLQ